MSYRIFPFLNPETIKIQYFGIIFFAIFGIWYFFVFSACNFSFFAVPQRPASQKPESTGFFITFLRKNAFSNRRKLRLNYWFLFLCLTTWTSCATYILIADCQRVQKGLNKLYKKRPTNFIQTVQCIIGCTTEFTTLYNGQLLLLRLLCIAITSTTKIDALFMIGFLFSSEALNSRISLKPSILGTPVSLSPIFGFRKNNFQIICSYLKW